MFWRRRTGRGCCVIRPYGSRRQPEQRNGDGGRCVCVCVCVCARARASVRACVRVFGRARGCGSVCQGVIHRQSFGCVRGAIRSNGVIHTDKLRGGVHARLDTSGPPPVRVRGLLHCQAASEDRDSGWPGPTGNGTIAARVTPTTASNGGSLRRSHRATEP